MISRLAKQTVERWIREENLSPTYEDIIRLNALGLKVERGTEAYDFSAVPRVAFLGDYVLYEPTVAKRIWMDTVMQTMDEGYYSRLFFIAWCLNCPDGELPHPSKVKEIVSMATVFRDRILLQSTETQILLAIDYVLRGSDPRTDEGIDEKVKEDFDTVYEIPEETRSAARQVLCEALGYGLDSSVERLMLPELERMVLVAAMHKGVDVFKNEHTQNAARFYACANKIHGRLLKGKDEQCQSQT